MSRALLVVAFAIGTTGCPNKAEVPACPEGHYLVAVAADREPGGTIYVADSVPPHVGYPYTVERASSLIPVLRSTNDGSPLALLAPASGGMIVVNGGAAARRFDAPGALLWTLGYAASVGVQAALTGQDRLVVADTQSLRLFNSDGSAVWEKALPETTERVLQVVGDREDGSWVLGTFAGTFLPWVNVAVPPPGVPSGPFVLHFDGSGAVIGAGAWDASLDDGDNQVVMAIDAADAPMLLAKRRPKGAPPVATAFDSAGHVLWSRPLAYGVDLEVDPDGNVLALSRSSTPGTLLINRWDATGGQGADTSFSIETGGAGGMLFSVAPVAGGVVVAGELLEQGQYGCPRRHFLLQIATDNLDVAPLPLGLP